MGEELNRFYVSKRGGWFLGGLTHAVKDKRSGNRIICVAPQWSCELIANALNQEVHE